METAPPRFVSVLGWSGTGKTSLVVLALRECARRGIPAAAAKRAHHAPAPAGKDSGAFLEAGALAALYLGDEGLELLEPAPERADAAFYRGRLPGAALVFLEGAVVEGALVVETAGQAREASALKVPLDLVDVLVTDDPGLAALARASGAAAIPTGDAAELLDIAEARHGT